MRNNVSIESLFTKKHFFFLWFPVGIRYSVAIKAVLYNLPICSQLKRHHYSQVQVLCGESLRAHSFAVSIPKLPSQPPEIEVHYVFCRGWNSTLPL